MARPRPGRAPRAAAAFGGHDWWIGPQWSLGIAGVLATATPATLRDGDTATDT